MSTSPPKSTFDTPHSRNWLRALWEKCKFPECSPSSAREDAVTNPAVLRWMENKTIALRVFDFNRDADAVCAFQQETYALNFSDFQYTDHFARAFRHDLRRASLDENNGLFVLEERPSSDSTQRVAGFLWLIVYLNHWTGEKYGYVNNVSVDARLRGRGLGHELMGEVDHFFRSRGVHTVRLSVTVTNEAATHLYLSNGYKTTRWEMEKHL